jgi:hypothetical protein
MINPNPETPKALETLVWDPHAINSNVQPRQCTRDCYGRVHQDVILTIRLRTEPPVMSRHDPRGLLLAREILDSEELGYPVVREVIPVQIDHRFLPIFRASVKAWLDIHPDVDRRKLVAQALRVKYVRAVH